MTAVALVEAEEFDAADVVLIPEGYALGRSLPGVYHDDRLIQLVCSAIDHLMAPVVTTLDSFWAYLDPETADSAFVDWLASWVGLDLVTIGAPLERRQFVKAALRLHAQRGTAQGIRDAVRMWFGFEPEITDSGAMGWSYDPEAPLPGSPDTLLTVTLRVPDPAAVDVRVLEAVVLALKPAHVPHVVEVVAAPSS